MTNTLIYIFLAQDVACQPTEICKHNSLHIQTQFQNIAIFETPLSFCRLNIICTFVEHECSTWLEWSIFIIVAQCISQRRRSINYVMNNTCIVRIVNLTYQHVLVIFSGNVWNKIVLIFHCGIRQGQPLRPCSLIIKRYVSQNQDIQMHNFSSTIFCHARGILHAKRTFSCILHIPKQHTRSM